MLIKGNTINDYGKTGEKPEGQKVRSAEETANQADKQESSNWTTGKAAPKSEREIVNEAAQKLNGENAERELLRAAERREAASSHDGSPQKSYSGSQNCATNAEART